MRRWMAGMLAALMCSAAHAAERPRLVVQMTFDQLRGDLLERYRRALSGGLKRVMDDGWWVRHGDAAHGITVSWPGHATLATGLYPSHHGWTANEWWMDVGGRWQEVDAATDSNSRELGREGRPGKSTLSLNATSIGDWFKAASPRSKVVAIGSDAAVPYGGRKPDALFWYDGLAGGYTTSTNYASTLPPWVGNLNAKITALAPVWTFSGESRWLTLAEHPQRCPPFQPGGGFPHRFSPSGNERSVHSWIGSTPLAEEELLREAGEIVRANGLGSDDVPDYLNLAIGSTDSVGHEYGPVSPEQLDTVIRMDRALGVFLDELDRTVGKGRYVVAISADHGAADPPEERCVHRVTTAEIDALLDRVEAIARRHRGSRAALVAAIVSEIEKAPFIGAVYTPERLARSAPSDWRARLMNRSFRAGHTPNFPLWSEKPRPFHPARYGIFVIFKEGMIFDAAKSVHGSPYAYDRLVPVIFYGAGVPRRTLMDGARTVDVAPTLASLAGIAAPRNLDGHPLLKGAMKARMEFPLAIVMVFTAQQGVAQTSPPRIAVPVTYSFNYDPTLSPDGTRMIFLKVLEGREQMFIANVDGSDERQLSHDTVDIEDPAWSPDGSQVAYVRIEGARNALYVANLAGQGARRLSPPTQSPIHPAWTPDGRSILYCTNDDLDRPRKNAGEIYRIEVATGKIATVISGGVNTYPVPSPDGRRIAFRKMLDINSEVFVADADGSNLKNVTDHPAFEGWPAWSPDGKRIAFGANRNSSYQIFVMDSDGKNVKLVANTEGRATAPKWSPDGRSIYFSNCWKTGLKSACEILVAPAPSP